MELFFLDGNIDADDILPNDTTCADIQVSIFIRICARSERKEKKNGMKSLPDFRVTHQTFAKPNSRTVRQEGAICVFLCQRVHIGCISCIDRVSFGFFRDTPTIVDTIGNRVSVIHV